MNLHPSKLSKREFELAQAIANSVPLKEVAAERGVSLKTVWYNHGNLKRKLGISDKHGSCADALITRWAIQIGIATTCLLFLCGCNATWVDRLNTATQRPDLTEGLEPTPGSSNWRREQTNNVTK